MNDVWGYISKFIETNKDKCYLMMTCSWISHCEFYFEEIVLHEKIMNTMWYNKFTNIDELSDLSILPRSITHLIFSEGISGFHFYGTDYDIKGKIPSTVTHLKFRSDFNQSIDQCIPPSVTHLEFGYCFNQDIIDCIPSSVIEITFGDDFQYPINNIPSSVTIINFNISGNVNKEIIQDLPLSVKEVNFTGSFHELEKRDVVHIICGLTCDEGEWIFTRENVHVQFFEPEKNEINIS